ncbi:MAG: transcription termination/antitermination protein NusA [Clostridia bacterium]|nr:transcription termination/antitermination protein NusA [Clostridia bacterium]
MKNAEFFEAVAAMASEKGVPVEALYEAISKSIITSIKKDYGDREEVIVVDINPEKQTLRTLIRRVVVDEVTDPVAEISLEDARNIKKRIKIGDFIDKEINTKEISRINAVKGKHLIRQNVGDAEQERKRVELKDKEQELATAKVIRVDPDTKDCIIEIGKVIERLPRSEQIPTDDFMEGDYIKVYISEIKEGTKGPKAMVSRTHKGLVRRLLEIEVPEIMDGTVEIYAVEREAGSRSKIAVFSNDENVDPVGACIGQKGARINRIVDALGGEKLDVVNYSADPAEFVAASLAPAEVISVEILSEDEKSCRVTVPNNQLSLAIGNKGQNARLAARLTGWKIDIKPEFEEPVINFDVE